MEYILKEKGCVGFDLSKEEYYTCATVVLQGRIKKVETEILNLVSITDKERARAMVEEIFKKVGV